MAFLYPDEGLLTKADSSALTYAELAALRQRALAGDASAAIAFERLPQKEQRLADMLIKSFGGSTVTKPKPKKAARKNTAARKANTRALTDMLKSSLGDPDPAVREAAREALSRG